MTKEATSLKESEKRYMGGFKGRKQGCCKCINVRNTLDLYIKQARETVRQREGSRVARDMRTWRAQWPNWNSFIILSSTITWSWIKRNIEIMNKWQYQDGAMLDSHSSALPPQNILRSKYKDFLKKLKTCIQQSNRTPHRKEWNIS